MKITESTRAAMIAAGMDPDELRVPRGKAAEGKPPAAKPNKYGAKPTIYNGVRYDSKSEAARAELLDGMVKGGLIAWWVGQPVFRLGCPENVYRADFLVVHHQGVHVEDVKGHETSKFKRDRKLWASYGPCELWLIKGKAVEVIHPKAKEAS